MPGRGQGEDPATSEIPHHSLWNMSPAWLGTWSLALKVCRVSQGRSHKSRKWLPGAHTCLDTVHLEGQPPEILLAVSGLCVSSCLKHMIIEGCRFYIIFQVTLGSAP